MVNVLKDFFHFFPESSRFPSDLDDVSFGDCLEDLSIKSLDFQDDFSLKLKDDLDLTSDSSFQRSSPDGQEFQTSDDDKSATEETLKDEPAKIEPEGTKGKIHG